MWHVIGVCFLCFGSHVVWSALGNANMEFACVIFGSCPQPICKNGYVMVLDAVFGCDSALVSWAPILDRKQI